MFLSLLTELHARLIQKGLPAHYVDRLVCELRDHAEETVRDQILSGDTPDRAELIAGRRLGTLDAIEEEAVTRGRRSTCRHQ